MTRCMHVVYILGAPNESEMLTLAILENEFCEPGAEVTFVWGEEGRGSAKPTVERHMQTVLCTIVVL